MTAYAVMETPDSIGGMGATLSVERVQKPHRESVPSIGVWVQTIGVSGALAYLTPAVGKLISLSVERVPLTSVDGVRVFRWNGCQSTVFQMRADAKKARKHYKK